MARPDFPITLWLAEPKAADRFDPATQSCSDQQRWRQIRSQRRRLDWMVSRALLARVSPPAGHAVSLSHSNGHAAVAVAPPGLQTGVDLEFARPRDVVSLARLAFSKRERADMEPLSGRARTQHFYTLWTLKEALAKALGVDLATALQEFEILVTPDGWQVRSDTDLPWSAQVFAPRESLILAVVFVGATTSLTKAGPAAHREWPQVMLSPWKCIADIRYGPGVLESSQATQPAHACGAPQMEETEPWSPWWKNAP